MKSLEQNNKLLFVSLGSEIDIERFFQYSTNVRLEELQKPTDFIYFQIKNLIEAKELCGNFIKEYNLGSSNWIGGRVVDEENNFVALISYNGNAWDNEDWKIAKKIELC